MESVSVSMMGMAVGVALFLLIFFAVAGARLRRRQMLVDMDAVLADERLREAVLDGRGRSARRRYRHLTGASRREARHRVNELIANPELLDVVSGKKKRPDLAAVEGEGVRNLIADGRIAEAVDVYRNFMGVDKFTAEQAVLDMQREMRLSDGEEIVEELPESASQSGTQEKSRWA